MSVLAFHDSESCDRCGTRGCVRRPVRLDDGEALQVCWDCYRALDSNGQVDHLGRPGPSPTEIELEEFIAGHSYGFQDPANPATAYLRAENPAKLDEWR